MDAYLRQAADEARDNWDYTTALRLEELAKREPSGWSLRLPFMRIQLWADHRRRWGLVFDASDMKDAF